jgi:hypothetical protein
MTSSKDRRWRRHMADEAVAIARQQASAGDDHSPVKAPQPRTDRDINALATASAEQARHDCIELLERLVEDARSRGEQVIPLADLQALAARMREKPEQEPS